VRFPDGTDSQRFFEKRAPSHTPDWVRTVPIEMNSAGTIEFVVCDDRGTLIWLAQLAALELHPSLSLVDDPDTPTLVAFDLDPGEPASIVECAEVALRLRGLFERFGLEAFPKTSGSKGMQVYLPLNDGVDYEQTKGFARAVAEALARSEPDRVVSQQKKELRGGKVLVDWSQNDRSKTTVAAYSLRCRPRPSVSTPLLWEEVERLASDRDPEAVRFEAGDVLDRIERHGDLFAPVVDLEQVLPRKASTA
jgi:bifunctional non-homologous end joining protein LigD